MLDDILYSHFNGCLLSENNTFTLFLFYFYFFIFFFSTFVRISMLLFGLSLLIWFHLYTPCDRCIPYDTHILSRKLSKLFLVFYCMLLKRTLCMRIYLDYVILLWNLFKRKKKTILNPCGIYFSCAHVLGFFFCLFHFILAIRSPLF